MNNKTNKQFLKYLESAENVIKFSEEFSSVSNDKLKVCAYKLKLDYLNGKQKDVVMQKSFGLALEAIYRVYGIRLNKMQIIGGLAIAEGNVIEMKTGEGKTLTAVLPSFYGSLSGKPVHVMTANEYLARRDAEEIKPILDLLGVNVSYVDSQMPRYEKHQAYKADIVYGTISNFGFDFLRDNLVHDKRERVMNGLGIAIADEADSLLLDQARIPLILSGRNLIKISDYEKKMVKIAKDFADSLTEKDVDIDSKAKRAWLNDNGYKKAEELFGLKIKNLDINVFYYINNAIAARFVFKNKIDYIVDNGKIVLIDKNKARRLNSHRFDEGLQMAIEYKEGVEITPVTKTIGKITIQNFIKRYKNVAGMSGTIRQCKDEFADIYGLNVVEIPTNEKLVRKDKITQIYSGLTEKYYNIVKNVQDSHEKGQPVLIGVSSIDESQLISKMLTREGISHNVLNAINDEKEAEIIADAGRFGAVTVATDMAGRGTDIKLGGDVNMIVKHILKENSQEDISVVENFALNDALENRQKVIDAGGLKVIATTFHQLERLDEQLMGRAGRQGDVGESIFYVSREDEIAKYLYKNNPKFKEYILKYCDCHTEEFRDKIIQEIRNFQKINEANDFESRKSLVEFDEELNRQYNAFYKLREEVLDGKDIDKIVLNSFVHLIKDVSESVTDENVSKDLKADYQIIFDKFIKNKLDFNDKKIALQLQKTAEQINSKITPEFLEKSATRLLLDNMDEYFVTHLAEIEFLKSIAGVSSGFENTLRSFNNEAHAKYNEMIDEILLNFAIDLIKKGSKILDKDVSSTVDNSEKSAD